MNPEARAVPQGRVEAPVMFVQLINDVLSEETVDEGYVSCDETDGSLE